MKRIIILAGIFIATHLSNFAYGQVAEWVNNQGCYCGGYSSVPVSFISKGNGTVAERTASQDQMGYWNLYATIYSPTSIDTGLGAPENGLNEVNTFINFTDAESIYGISMNPGWYGVTIIYPVENFGLFNECKNFDPTGCDFFIETDVLINADFTNGWTTNPNDYSGKALVQTTALHELGHTWGAHHVFSLPAFGDSFSVMNYMNDDSGQFVTRMDANTIRAHYPTVSQSIVDVGIFPFIYGNSQYAETYTSVSPTSVQTGQQINISNFLIQNIGTLDAANTVITFYLSTDTIIENTDYSIGTVEYTSLPVDADNDFNATFIIPGNVPDGIYYIGAIVTVGGVEDSIEINNKFIIGRPYRMPIAVGLEDLLSEDFDGVLPPAGWTIIDNAGTGAVWSFDNPGGRNNYTGGTGNFAIADNFYYGAVSMDTELRTPSIDMSSMTSVLLEFKTWFRTSFYEYEVADVDISTNGAIGPWTNIWHKTSDYTDSDIVYLNISDLSAGKSNVIVRFRYYNTDVYEFPWYWQVDDVIIRGVGEPTYQEYYVESNDICGGNNPCYSTIQDGIDAVGDGATIKVAQGTYHENIWVTSSKTNLSIQAGWDPTFTSKTDDPTLTIIDGDTTGDGFSNGPAFGIEAADGVDVDVSIEGFTFTHGGGWAAGVYAWSYGGTATLTLTNNILTGNFGVYGGGVSARSLSGGTTIVALTNNTITGNLANFLGGGVQVDSGFNSMTTVSLINNIITGNSAPYGSYFGSGIAALADGGTTTLILTNNTITANSNSLFFDSPYNDAGIVAYSYLGGTTTLDITNTIVWGNNATENVDDIYLIEDDSSGDSNTIVNVSYSDIGDVVNDGGTYFDDGTSINEDPLFVNPAGGDYHLQASSPAIDAGICGSYMYGRDYRTAPYDDFEGDPRPDPGDLICSWSMPTGCMAGWYAGCDIGADEYDEYIGWTQISGRTSAAPSVACNSTMCLLVVRSRSTDEIWRATFNSSGTFNNDWVKITGRTSASPSVACNSTMCLLVVRSRSTDEIWRATFNSSGTFNYDWVKIPGRTSASPSVACNSTMCLLVVRSASSSDIWASTFNSSGTFNNDWTLIPGRTPSAPALAWNPVASEFQIVVRGTRNNQIWASTFNSSGTFNNDWTLIPGGISSAPAIAWNSVASEFQIVVRGTRNNQIWASTFHSSGTFNNDWELLDGETASAPAIAWNTVNNKFLIVVRHPDSTIWTIRY